MVLDKVETAAEQVPGGMTDAEWRVRCDLVEKPIMILRNHGLMPLCEATQRKSIAQDLKMYGPGGFIEVGLEWPALLRQLERAGLDDYRV